MKFKYVSEKCFKKLTNFMPSVYEERIRLPLSLNSELSTRNILIITLTYELKLITL